MKARTLAAGNVSRSLCNSRSKWTKQALFAAVEPVVDRIKIADQRARERCAQRSLEHGPIAMTIDQEQCQARVSKTPGPRGQSVDPPTGLIALHDRRIAQEFPEFVDHRLEQSAAPTQMAEQSGPAGRKTKEVFQQVLRFAERDAQVNPRVADQQARAWPDVGAGQFQVAASLAGGLAMFATVGMTAIPMPFELGLWNLRHLMLFELAGGGQIVAAAMRTLSRMHVMFDEYYVFRYALGRAAALDESCPDVCETACGGDPVRHAAHRRPSGFSCAAEETFGLAVRVARRACAA